MEDITQSLNFIPQNKRTKQKISDELRKLIIDEMNSGSKPGTDTFLFLNKPAKL